VANVSYYAAEAFCAWLTTRLPAALAGYEARLPSESEWEWAARGGLAAQPYPLGAVPAGAVFAGSGAQGPAPVGASAANGFGLKDMSGNVWEWCADWYSPVKYLFSSWEADRNGTDGADNPPTGFEKVVRGGSWSNERELVRVYTRGSQPPSWCTPYLGFRVVLARIDR
jgi:formylglycine-generating enzyme required for sulfatase activity